MTIVLNPYPGLPIRTPAPTPAAPPREGEPGGDAGFGNLMRGLIYPCAGAPGFLESAAPDAKPGASSPVLAADVFNQDGFFEGAVPADEQGQPDRVLTSEAPISTVQTPFDDSASSQSETPDYRLHSVVRPGAPTPSLPADAPTISPGAVASTWPPISTAPGNVQSAMPDASGSIDGLSSEIVPIRLASDRTLAPAAIKVAARGEAERGSDAPSAIRTTSFRARLEALLPRLFAQDGAALNTRVSVQAVEHGLYVVAKLDDLGREERIRLRDRIAATLSRHGLIGREIMLNGDKDMAPAEGNH